MALNLPIIDISPFITWADDDCVSPQNRAQPSIASPKDAASLTAQQHHTITKLRAAVQHPGFFYLLGHGIPQHLMDDVITLGKQFYTENTPEAKNEVARLEVGVGPGRGGDGARGYQEIDEDAPPAQSDWQENLDFYADITDITAHRAFKASRADVWPGMDGLLEGRNLWPRHPARMEGVYGEYVWRMCAVGSAVMRAMGLALGLRDPDFFVEQTRDSFWCLRVMGYPPLPAAGGAEVSCGEHSDYGCLTFLLADETKGALRVKTVGNQRGDGGVVGEKDGTEKEEWVDADPVKGAFVVNIGDMVEQWTGGWAKSTRHKVVHRGDGYRVSMPFFFEPSKHVVVRRLAEFGGKEGDPEVRYWDHLVSKIDGSFYRKVTSF